MEREKLTGSWPEIFGNERLLDVYRVDIYIHGIFDK